MVYRYDLSAFSLFVWVKRTMETSENLSCQCRVSGVPAGRECSGKLRRSAILAVRRTLTGNRGEYLRVVGIHSDG